MVAPRGVLTTKLPGAARRGLEVRGRRRQSRALSEIAADPGHGSAWYHQLFKYSEMESYERVEGAGKVTAPQKSVWLQIGTVGAGGGSALMQGGGGKDPIGSNKEKNQLKNSKCSALYSVCKS